MADQSAARDHPTGHPSGTRPGAAEPALWLDRALARHGLHLAMIVAWTAMLGSLYFSEIRNFQPCVLCWYQRILLYPIALLIPVAILRRDRGAHAYVLALALADIPVSLYHYLDQKTDWFVAVKVCHYGVSCRVDYINWFGFVTIPMLALIAALLIVLTTSAWARGGAWTAPEGARPWRGVLASIAIVWIFYAVVYAIIG